MKKTLIIALLLITSTLKAVCDDGYTVIHKYQDGGLLQIDRSSIHKKYGFLVYYNYDDFENVVSCYEHDRYSGNIVSSYEKYKQYLRNNKCTNWYFVKAKIRGEEIKMVMNEKEYSIFDTKNGRMSSFYEIKLNTPTKLIQDYTCSFKGRRMLRKLEKEATKK